MVAVIEVRARHSTPTEAVNVWHWRIPETNVGTEVDGIINTLDVFYETVKSRYNAGTVTVEGLVRTVDQNPNEYISRSGLTTSCTGTNPGSLATCVVGSIRSNLVGGSRRGRKYFGPLDRTVLNTDGRTIASAVVTDFLNALTLVVTYVGNGVEHGVWSRTNQVFTPANICSINPVAGTQRRRLT